MVCVDAGECDELCLSPTYSFWGSTLSYLIWMMYFGLNGCVLHYLSIHYLFVNLGLCAALIYGLDILREV